MTYTARRSSPGGCFLILLGLIPAAFGVLGAWGIAKWLMQPATERVFDSVFWCIAAALILGWGGALVLSVIGWRALRSADFRNFDPSDPDQNKLKW